jgi:O-antigen/teichoic acid export membrane protein
MLPPKAEAKSREARPSVTEPASLVANSSVMFLTRVFALLTLGALSIYAIRTFSIEAYAHFAIAFALISIFGLLSEMGISTVALRELATHADRQNSITGIALWAEIVTSGLAIALMLPIAFLLGYSHMVLVIIAIGAGVILFQGVLAAIEACFQARRLLVYPALFWTVQAGVTAAVGFAAVGLGWGPRGLAAALTVGYAAATPIAFALLLRRLGVRPELAGTWRRIGPFVRTALPIAATGGMAIIYDRVDVLMLSKLASTRAVAIYNVPLTILQYSMIVPAIVATAFFPLLTETLRSSPAQARESFGLLARIFVLISVPLAIVLSAGGETVLTTLFGERYRDSAGPLAVLAWSIVLGFFNYLLWYSLLAAYREGMKFVIMVVGLVLNVGLNLVLIPAYGPLGAAVSLICSDLLVVLWQGALVRRHLFAVSLSGLLTKPLLAGAAALLVTLLLLPVAGLLAGIAGAIAYVTVLLGIRYISLAEWGPLLTPIRAGLLRLRTSVGTS